MNSKILILSIAVVAIGLFAMPSTLSLFSGQHTFVTGDNVSCRKCHADIFDEIGGTSNEVHNTANFTGYTNGTGGCEGCHRTGTIGGIPVNGTNLTGTYTQTIASNPNAHAAVTLECIACHSGVEAELNGTEEAHTPYYRASNRSIGGQTVIALKGANTACVGCHTHVRVNLTWVRLTDYNVTANATSGSWNVNISNDWMNSTSTTYTNKSY